MKLIKNIFWNILNIFHIAGPLQIVWRGKYLNETGWLTSFHLKESVDNQGRPIPWCSYPFIRFIEPRLTKQLDLFEFGCGNSTLWYAEKVHSIKSVDHDKGWVEKITERLPVNAVVLFRTLDDSDTYSKEILNEEKEYHIVIIDGRDRNNCVQTAVRKLAPDGVIVFDNTQLIEYATSMHFLKERGFLRLDFYGLLPIVPHENCTTIFYRQHN